jgi:hypothetical protein
MPNIAQPTAEAAADIGATVRALVTGKKPARDGTSVRLGIDRHILGV